jgi:hypothetical protein
MGRLHSRSRSPKRALISSRNRRHDYDYDYDYDHRHGEGSTLHQTYSYPATDECYDRTDTRRYLSRFFPDAEEEPRGAFHHSLAAADYRVTNWKWSSRHDYHVYNDGPDQYVGEGYHDQADSGIGGSELCRDYSFTSQLDPYQL